MDLTIMLFETKSSKIPFKKSISIKSHSMKLHHDSLYWKTQMLGYNLLNI